MKMNKPKKSAVAIYGIIAVLFIFLTVLIPFPKPASSWIMFAFSIISLAVGAGISIYAFGKPKDLMSKFYGYPIFRIGYLYTAAQLITTVILYAVGAFFNVPYWIGLLLSLIYTGAASIGFIVTDNSRDFIENIDANTVNATKTITSFQIDISDILDACKDEKAREPLQNLATKFKYSDPVSIEETKEIESEITKELKALKTSVSGKNTEATLVQIEKVVNLLNSRNSICGSYK
mgnify:FL=1